MLLVFFFFFLLPCLLNFYSHIPTELAGFSDLQLEEMIPPHDPYPSFFSYLGPLFEPFNFAAFLFVGFAFINISVIIVSFINVGLSPAC